MSESLEDTQPTKIKKSSRLWANLLTGLAVLVFLSLSVFGGYQVAMSDRVAAKNNSISQQLMEQYQLALVDIQFSRYETARDRLEFIINNDPNFPGASEKLTEVLVVLTVPTATVTPIVIPTSTPNPSGVENAFASAQQLIAAGDWANALAALDATRKADPTYKTGQVDGMYYYALRNYGYDLITKQGNLEGGIYQLTLAERFAPLDNTANGLREGARAYITGASFYGVDWKQAVYYLGQVYNGWPSLWDGTMTASKRYQIASMRYGDQLLAQRQYCEAVQQYQNASAIGSLDETANKGYNQAYQACYPPTEVPTIPAVVPTDTPIS